MSNQRAVLARGCPWRMQDLIRRQPGVASIRVGCTGGDVANATYGHHAGHAEATEMVLDPAATSYRALLELAFQIHDPNTRDQQGVDLGSSYRSAIYQVDDEQNAVALDAVADVDAWEAEPEHQDHLERYPDGYTCHVQRPDRRLQA